MYQAFDKFVESGIVYYARCQAVSRESQVAGEILLLEIYRLIFLSQDWEQQGLVIN